MLKFLSLTRDRRRIDPEIAGKQLFQLINPVHHQQEDSMVWAEGGLGVVGYTAKVQRSARVLVNAWTVDEKEIEAEGLLVVAPQREVDHLDDKLFIDRLSALKRDLYKRKIKNMLRRACR